MSAASAAQPLKRAPKDAPQSTANTKWAIGFLIVAVAVFVFYQYMYPDLSPGPKTFFRSWLPITSVNEALVFVIMALGLNIVVGYAGLLDLGYVAF
jgi:branched-chain amino acid transport system permease protein